MSAKFPLGQIVITANAKDKLHPSDVNDALDRHVKGDWGDVDEHDRQENEISVAQGFRLLSVYQDRNSVKFWIITEADRSANNVELNISRLMWSCFECGVESQPYRNGD